jgi:hypothetical protein
MGPTTLPHHTDLVVHSVEEIHYVFVLSSLREEFIRHHFSDIYRDISKDFGLPPITTCDYCFEDYWEYTCDFTDLNAMVYLTEDDPDHFPPDIGSWTEEIQSNAQDCISDDFAYDQHLFAIDFHNTCRFFHMAYRERIGFIHGNDFSKPICRLVNGAVVGVW